MRAEYVCAAFSWDATDPFAQQLAGLFDFFGGGLLVLQGNFVQLCLCVVSLSLRFTTPVGNAMFRTWREGRGGRPGVCLDQRCWCDIEWLWTIAYINFSLRYEKHHHCAAVSALTSENETCDWKIAAIYNKLPLLTTGRWVSKASSAPPPHIGLLSGGQCLSDPVTQHWCFGRVVINLYVIFGFGKKDA